MFNTSPSNRPKTQRKVLFAALLAVLGANLLISPLTARAEETAEFSKSNVYIEINSTDGDAGFHALIDADAWHDVKMRDSNGQLIFKEQAKGSLNDQGITENFFESAEPLCAFDPEEPDELVVPLAEFLPRFPEGDYPLSGYNNEGEMLMGTAELTYDIPAAPDASAMEDAEFAIDEVLIEWEPGTTLGEKCHDQNLVDLGIIADPEFVPVVAWELTIEPEGDDLPEPERTLTVLLPPEQTSFEVPEAYFAAYVDEGYTEFKFEVGSHEAGGNRVFTEVEFEIEEED